MRFLVINSLHGITDRSLMISYELAQELKAAGYPIKKHLITRYMRDIAVPTLEELIEACRKLTNEPVRLYVNGERCRATGDHNSDGHSAQWYEGATPIDAVARLWLALHTK